MDMREEIEGVADQYRAEGYAVVCAPGRDLISGFAGEKLPDMIATRAGETVAVEVWPTRTQMAKHWDQSAALAEFVGRLPGWRLDVIVLRQNDLAAALAGESQEPSDQQLLEQIEQAGRMRDLNLPAAALTMAWASFEAAMRRVRDDAELYGKATPSELLNTLYSNGFLGREEFDRAREAMKIRNRIVHGFAAPTVDRRLIEDVLGLARKLLAGDNQPAPVA